MGGEQWGVGPKKPNIFARIGGRRMVVVAVVVMAFAGLAVAWALSRSSTGSPLGEGVALTSAESSPTPGQAAGSSSASPTTSLTPGTRAGGGTNGSASGASGASSTNGGSPASKNAVGKKPGGSAAPSQDVLGNLKAGEWQLYDSQLLSAGTDGRANGTSTVDNVSLEVQAQTLVDGRAVHAVFDCDYSAEAASASSGSAWKIFGTWTLTPDQPSSVSKHYVIGVSGAVIGTTVVKPPSADKSLTASVRPIGAYRSGGPIASGTFAGNSVFEGLLSLPSVGAPPPSK
jgi:hypothetical protein